MKWYIHVNQHKIRKNIHAEIQEPPVAIRKGKTGATVYCFEAAIPSGSVIRYSAKTPLLSCGARLVIECYEEPEIIG